MFRLFRFFLVSFVISQPLYADVIVRMEVQQGAAIDHVDLRLFDAIAPLNVANFLNYVNGTTRDGGSYENSFIHRRSNTPPVIQGGGFTFDPAVGDFSFTVGTGGLQEVTEDPAVDNEFNKSNLRGTIAMAKVAGDPDSATSQWFINLVDNLALDTDNGGFTVFGEVLSGMSVVDAIADLPVYNRALDIHPAFGELPLVNYTADPIVEDNLVRTSTITELLTITADIDFTEVLINTPRQSVIAIRNRDSVNHSIGDIAEVDTVAAPFSIVAGTDTCSNTPLEPDAVCTLTVEFVPDAESVFSDTFDIVLADIGLSYVFSLAGEGVSTPLLVSDDLDFGNVTLNTGVELPVTIRNLDIIAHSVGDIATADTIDAPFSIVAGSDSCSNTSLAPDDVCTFSVEFFPLSESVFNDTFNIELTSLGTSYVFSVVGEGVLFEPDIAPILDSIEVDSIEFPDTQIVDLSTGLPEQLVVFLNNEGNVDLNITSMTLGGPDAADFEFFDNCVTFSPVIPGGFCVLPVNFIPTTVGEKSATLTIISDDPDESPLVLPITGTASVDTDGIPEAVEDAAPNNGDGNNDAVLDSVQNTVASFPGINGAYFTMVTYTGNTLRDINVLSSDQLPAPPESVRFELGILEFTLDGLPAGATTQVGIILPPGYAPSTYYMYGPTPDNSNPHWYEFLFDGTTGAEFLSNASLIAPDGTTIQRNLIRLTFKDGDRGDSDLLANGVIVDPGAPVVSVEEGDSGSINLWTLLCLLAIPALCRKKYARS